MESADICTGSIDACASHIRSPSDISLQAHRREMKWGVFCKKGDLSSTQGALCAVSVFFILHFTLLGVRTHPTHPPAYGPALLVKTTDDKRKCRKKKKKHKSYTEVNNYKKMK